MAARAVGGGGPSTSRTNTSQLKSVSAGSRFEAPETNPTKRPSRDIAGPKEKKFPFAPAGPEARLTSVVVFAWTSRM